MIFKGITYCDCCYGAIFPEEVAPVRIEVDGELHQYHFHNRHPEDCLAIQLESLKQHFAAQQQ